MNKKKLIQRLTQKLKKTSTKDQDEQPFVVQKMLKDEQKHDIKYYQNSYEGAAMPTQNKFQMGRNNHNLEVQLNMT